MSFRGHSRPLDMKNLRGALSHAVYRSFGSAALGTSIVDCISSFLRLATVMDYLTPGALRISIENSLDRSTDKDMAIWGA